MTRQKLNRCSLIKNISKSVSQWGIFDKKPHDLTISKANNLNCTDETAV